MCRYDHRGGEDGLFDVDAWDGYVAARNRLLGLSQQEAETPAGIAGDVHSNWVADLQGYLRDEASAPWAWNSLGPPSTPASSPLPRRP